MLSIEYSPDYPFHTGENIRGQGSIIDKLLDKKEISAGNNCSMIENDVVVEEVFRSFVYVKL